MTDDSIVVELARKQMTELDEEISGLYREIEKRRATRYRLQAKIADMEGYPLPKPSRRTRTQELIAWCPRCGDQLGAA